MLKILLKLLIVPLFFIVPPLFILLATLQQGVLTAPTIKKTLARSNVYKTIEQQIPLFIGGNVQDSTNINSPQKAFISQLVTTYLPASYIKQKTETLLDDIDLWMNAKSTKEPILSFTDLQDKLKTAHSADVKKLDDLLSSLNEAKKQMQSEENQETEQQIPIIPSSFSDLLNKNLNFPLGTALFPLKLLGQTFMLVLVILSIFTLFAFLFILFLSPSLKSKLRWGAFSLLVAVSSLYILLLLIPQGKQLVSLFSRSIPQPGSLLAQPIIDAITSRPLQIMQIMTKTAMQWLLVIACASIAISFLDFSFQKKSVKRNWIVVFIGLVLTGLLTLTFFPYAHALPFIGKFLAHPTIAIETSTTSKTEYIGKKATNITIADSEAGFTMQIPQGAVLSGSTIELSPLVGLHNIPPGTALLAGIHIKADDMILQKPASITIELDEAPTKPIRGFMYDNDGKNFITFPVSVTSREITLPVLHASGYGLITVPDNFKDQSDGKNEVRAQAQQDILSVFSAIEYFQNFGKNDEITDQQKQGLKDILVDWWNRGVKPYINLALQKDEAIVTAMKEYLIWLQSVQAIGLEDEMASQIKHSQDDLARAIKKAVDNADRDCHEKKDPSQAGKLLKLYAIAESAAFDGVSLLNVEDIKKKALGCAQFKLEISSHFVDTDSSVCEGFNETYEGEIVLSPDEDFTLTGKGQVTAKSIKVCNKECRLVRGDGPVTTTIEIPSTQFSVTNNQHKVSIELIDTDESDNYYDCSYIIPGTDTEFGLHLNFGWEGSFYNLHSDESTSLFSSRIENWDITANQDAYAIKTYDRIKKPYFFIEGLPRHETTIFKLIHTPK